MIGNISYRLKRALNALYFWESGGLNRPALFDIDATYPSLRVFDRNVDVIQKELELLLREREAIPRYHEVAPTETYISGTFNTEKAWRVFMLRWSNGAGLEGNQAKCPKTSALIDRVPGVIQAFFSILEAGKSIPAHDGPYLGYLRYHLGLRVPPENPPTIRVKDHFHTWEVGKSILFDDSWNHEVINRSKDVRVVLIVDVLRPMRFPAHALNWFSTSVLSRFTKEAKETRQNLANYQPD